MGPSIEEELEKALEQLLQKKIVLQAASRTDRGVHAQGQVVNFFTDRLLDFREINALLPPDIRILTLAEVSSSFHPTLDVIEKTYSYAISPADFQNPFERHYSWHVFHPLNVALMKEAALLIEGTHDFQGFTNRKLNDTYKNTTRTVNKIEFFEYPDDYLKIQITGIHFMYKMVRNIIGTLVFIGCKKLPIHVIHDVLNNKNRALAGITSPAHGLTLINIKYDDSFKLPLNFPEKPCH